MGKIFDFHDAKRKCQPYRNEGKHTADQQPAYQGL